MTNILILGAGFGGINTALKLEKKLKDNSDFKITLVDRNNFHLFAPSLYEVATVYGLIEDNFSQYLRGSVAIPFSEILENKKINFIQAEIKEINLKEKNVMTNGGARLDFDYLVIALGGETEFYGIPGVQDYAFNFKLIDDAIGVYKKIKEIYENYERGSKEKDIKINIIGGGFTGVELSAELGCCVENIIEDKSLNKKCTIINLIEAGPVILPAIDQNSREVIEKRLRSEMVQIQTNSPVSEVGSDYIKINPVKSGEAGPPLVEFDGVNGELVKSDLTIWTGGIRGSRLLENSGLRLTKNGTVEVNEFLQAKNPDSEKIFVIGDNATFIDPKTQRPVPAMAYIAFDQAVVAAGNIINHSQGRQLRPYGPLYDAWIAPAGGKWAYLHYRGFQVSGFVGYILRQLVDLRYFLRILPLGKALKIFFKDLVIFTKND